MFVVALYSFPIWWLILYELFLGLTNKILSVFGPHLYEVVTAEVLGFGLGAGFIIAILIAGQRWYSGRSMLFFFGMLGTWLAIWCAFDITQGALYSCLQLSAGRPMSQMH